MASRALQIPANIDVLYCEQEVVADETKSIDAVLKADKKRTALLAEEKELVLKLSDGGMEIADRLKDVSGIGLMWDLNKCFTSSNQRAHSQKTSVSFSTSMGALQSFSHRTCTSFTTYHKERVNMNEVMLKDGRPPDLLGIHFFFFL